jgi:hypothetical protein
MSSITIIGRNFYDAQFDGRVVNVGNTADSSQLCMFGDLTSAAKYVVISKAVSVTDQDCLVERSCLECKVPAVRQAQSVFVSISINSVDFFNGSTPVSFIYFADPVVSSVWPMAGPSVGGTQLLIRGSNFQ